MVKFSAVCLFCEDIREEKSGLDIILGTFPDNLVIEGPPPPTQKAQAILPRLGIYMRVNIDVTGDKPRAATIRVENNAGADIARGEWTSALLDQSFAETKEHKMPFAGLVFKLVLAPVPIVASSGQIRAFLTIDGNDQLIGALNIILSTASERPASQSPTVS